MHRSDFVLKPLMFGLTSCMMCQAYSFSALSSDAPHPGKLVNPANHFQKFDSCIETAHIERSQRDADFFIKVRAFSDKKRLFVTHSISNERRFCSDIEDCWQKFSVVGSQPLNKGCLEVAKDK